jgi:hypothetical protein
MQYVWQTGEVYTGFWLGNMRETDHFGDPGVDGKIILRWSFAAPPAHLSNVTSKGLQDIRFPQRCCWGFDATGK